MSADTIKRLIKLLYFYDEEHNPAKFGGCCSCDWCKECGELMAVLKTELKEQGDSR